MMPRALATLTIPLLNPLSCQAIAVASEDGAPLAPAIVPIWPAVMRPPVAPGPDDVPLTAGTMAAGAAPGTRSVVPAMTKALGDSPLAPASAAVVMPLAAAMPVSVSPGTTWWPPPVALPLVADVAAAGAAGAGAPAPGSRSDVPASSRPAGFRPLTAASWDRPTPC